MNPGFGALKVETTHWMDRLSWGHCISHSLPIAPASCEELMRKGTRLSVVFLGLVFVEAKSKDVV